MITGVIRKKGITILAGVYLAIVTIALFILFRSWSYDDPFITYRYADNLHRGLGFVYNPGQQVLSTTTPLFAILLAVMEGLWGDLPNLANLIGAFSLALGGLFCWNLARAWGPPTAGYYALLLYPTFPLLLATLGSEMPLYLALCLGTILFYTRTNYSLASVFAAFAVLARPDGVLVAIILACDYLIRVRRRIPWLGVGFFLGLTMPWMLFAWFYFGTPVPGTLAAKQHQGMMEISQSFASGLLTIARTFASNEHYGLEVIFAAVGTYLVVRRARPWLLVVAWAVLYGFAYSVLGVSRYFWYYAPLVPAFVMLVGLGVSSIDSFKLLALSPKLSRGLSIMLFFLLAMTQVHDFWQLRLQPDDRFEIYHETGEWLRSNTPPEATVGTLEVGIIGYYAKRTMVDFAGLIQPDVSVQFRPQTTYEDVALWAVAHYHPNYLVLHDKYFPRLEQEYVSRNCIPVKQFPGKLYHYVADMIVYTCS